MTTEELKAALLSEVPVESGGIVYKCISAIIFRKAGSGKVAVAAELLDKNSNSVTIANPERIKEKEV